MANAAGRLATYIIGLALLAGCSRTIVKPRLASPGPAAYQRDNAVDFVDPYPPNDLGPEMVGARPPDFAVPLSEVKRANQYNEQRGIVPVAPRVAAPVPLY
jgi:hypothetical protein